MIQIMGAEKSNFRQAYDEIAEACMKLGMAEFEVYAAFDYMVEHADVYDPNKPIEEQLRLPNWFWKRVNTLKKKQMC